MVCPKFLMIIRSILMIIFLLSCQQEEAVVVSNDHKAAYPVKYELVEQAEKKFILDSLSFPNPFSVQYFEEDNGVELIPYFSFLNTAANALYFYNYDTREFSFRIKPEREGPNGVGKVNGFHIQSIDSIYLYNYYRQTLYLIDTSAKVYNQFFLNEESASQGNYLPTAQLSTIKPMAKIGDSIFISGYLAGEMDDENRENRPITKILNIKNGSVIHAHRYSDPYLMGNWGGKFFRNVYFTFNPDEKTFVFSFPIDHYVNKFTPFDTSVSRHYAGSRYFGDISSLPVSKTRQISRDRLIKFHSINPSYYGIIYDKYRKVYYRVAHLPISEEDFRHPDINISRMKQSSVIILDENLQYIGETLIPEYSYSFFLMFITEEGLNVQQWPHMELGEDTLRIKILSLEKAANL